MPDANSTVLVVDDDPDLRASVGRLLRSLGINTLSYLHPFRTFSSPIHRMAPPV
jgi:FixJ family two-component response regulator